MQPMQEVQILYTVAGVVIAALAAWVARVLATAPVFMRSEVGAGAGAGKPPKIDPAESLPKLAEDEDEEPTGPHAMILVTAVGRTDTGKKRATNEDAYLILEDHHVLAIADGMGRHAAGEVASAIATSAIEEAFAQSKRTDADELPSLSKRANQLRSAILYANARIWKKGQENARYEGMGTTVVAAYFSPNKQKVYLAHVGDSRCYRLRAGELKQLTLDHTLGAAGIKGRNEAVLVRALGVEPTVEVDVMTESPLPGDVYLLCSDGLTRMVDAARIAQTLRENEDLAKATAKLVELANAEGGKDNITAILARIAAAPGPP
jgi:protein phosphatase